MDQGRLLILALVLEVSLCAKILIVPVPLPGHVEEGVAIGQILRDFTHHSPVIALPSRYPNSSARYLNSSTRYLNSSTRYPQDEGFGGLEILLYDIPDDELVLGTPDYGGNITSKALEEGLDDEALLRFEAAAISYHCRYMTEDQAFMDEVSMMQFEFAVVDGYAWNPCMAFLAVYAKIPFAVWSSTLHPFHVRVKFDATVPAFGARVSHDMSTMERFQSMWIYMTSDISQYHDHRLLDRLPFLVQSWAGLLRKAKVFISTVDDTLAWSYPQLRGYLRVPGVMTGKLNNLTGTEADIVASKSTSSDIIVSFRLYKQLPDFIVLKLVHVLGATEKLVLTDLDPPAGETIQRPSNVHFVNSLPLHDLLGHPSFRVLVSACDSDMVYRALYHGVSVLCFPIMGAQHHTAHWITDREYGLSLDIRTFTEKDFFRDLSALLRPSSQIRANCRRISGLLQKSKSNSLDDVATEIDMALKLGDNYRPASVARVLWSIFIIEWVLIFAAMVAFLKVVLWCKATCAEDDEEENKSNTESKKNK